MKHLLSFFMICLPIAQVVAQEAQNKSPNVSFKLKRSHCAQLIINHKPADDVAYKPGVDVEGNPVAPADLPGSSKDYGLGKDVEIDLTLPLSQLAPAALAGSPNPYVRAVISSSQSVAKVGKVTVSKDGTVKINGQTVSDEAQNKIIQECRKRFPDL